MKALLLLAALAAAEADYYGRILEPANRLVFRPSTAHERPVPVPRRFEFAATEEVTFAWNGAGTAALLDPTPSLAAGIRVRADFKGGWNEVDQSVLRYYPDSRRLVVDGDPGIEKGSRVSVTFDSAAKVDGMSGLYPGLRTLRAKLFLAAAREDKELAFACRMKDEGHGMTLQVASSKMLYEIFRASEENLEVMRRFLDGGTGCAAREFPLPSGGGF